MCKKGISLVLLNIGKSVISNKGERRMNMEEQRVVLSKPRMARCKVRKDVIYKSIDGTDLKLDVYYPEDFNSTSQLPAVIFAHGEAPSEILHNAKDWGQYKCWGQLVAASGMIGITFTRRSSEGFTLLERASSDIVDLFTYVVTHATELGVNANNLGLWVCSAGGPACLSTILRDKVIPIRSIATLYPLMNLEHIDELRDHIDAATIAKYSPLSALEGKSGNEFPPMMIVRAGLDIPVFNNSIDDFINKSLKKNMNVVVVNHPSGNHAFDVRDDNYVSQMIIDRVLEFFKEHAT
jgi:hypothetical protein